MTLIQEDPFEAMEKQKRKERERSEREADERHLKVLKAQAAKVQRDQQLEAEHVNVCEPTPVGTDITVKMSLGGTKVHITKKKSGVI